MSLKTNIPFHWALHVENVFPLDCSFEQQSEGKLQHLDLQNLNEKHKNLHIKDALITDFTCWATTSSGLTNVFLRYINMYNSFNKVFVHR